MHSQERLNRLQKENHVITVKYSFSHMSIRKDARCHLDHSHTLLGIDHSEVLVYLWQSTGVSLCYDRTIGQGRGAEAGVIAEAAPS